MLKQSLEVELFIKASLNGASRFNYVAIESTINKFRFVILGIGGRSDSPDALYLIPLSEAKYTGLFQNFLDQFGIPLNKPIGSKMLWRK